MTTSTLYQITKLVFKINATQTNITVQVIKSSWSGFSFLSHLLQSLNEALKLYALVNLFLKILADASKKPSLARKQQEGQKEASLI